MTSFYSFPTMYRVKLYLYVTLSKSINIKKADVKLYYNTPVLSNACKREVLSKYMVLLKASSWHNLCCKNHQGSVYQKH